MSKVLARNPLSQSIFTKTSERPVSEPASRNQEPATTFQEPPFVRSEHPRATSDLIAAAVDPQIPSHPAPASSPTLAEQTEKVTCKLSVEMNDWLDSLLRAGRRKHGSKIPKETWIQAALELFRSQSQDWSEVATVEQLRQKLQLLVSGIR
jgi:hypothetical protein